VSAQLNCAEWTVTSMEEKKATVRGRLAEVSYARATVRENRVSQSASVALNTEAMRGPAISRR